MNRFVPFYDETSPIGVARYRMIPLAGLDDPVLERWNFS